MENYLIGMTKFGVGHSDIAWDWIGRRHLALDLVQSCKSWWLWWQLNIFLVIVFVIGQHLVTDFLSLTVIFYILPLLLPSCASDSALADHCARLQIMFNYLLTYLTEMTLVAVGDMKSLMLSFDICCCCKLNLSFVWSGRWVSLICTTDSALSPDRLL